MALRLQGMGQPNYARGFNLSLHPQALRLPLTWKKPQMVFVNSMSDLFHEDVPLDFIQRVFDIMRQAHWHQFQILTKRAERLLELDPLLAWPSNAWMGVTVEQADYAYRVDRLRRTHAAIKFLSLEPLLGPIPSLDLEGIHWVVVGGESGPGARPMDPKWATDLRDQCLAAQVPFFFKQWGGVNKKKAGRLLEGRTWDEMPEIQPAVSEAIAP
jgi:protein gp37